MTEQKALDNRKIPPYWGAPCNGCNGENFNGTVYHKTWCPTLYENWSWWKKETHRVNASIDRTLSKIWQTLRMYGELFLLVIAAILACVLLSLVDPDEVTGEHYE